jgi:hypothetical protein
VLLFALLLLLMSCYCWNPFLHGVSTVAGFPSIVGVLSVSGVLLFLAFGMPLKASLLLLAPLLCFRNVLY